MKKTTLVIFTILALITLKAQSQCNTVETITICDMTGIDGNGDSTLDGIINLYEQYNLITGVTPVSLTTGTWFDPNFNFALDETTGDLHLWDLVNASQSETDYQFQLINTSSSCPDGIITTVNLILGPFSGYGRPVLNIDDVNLEVCDMGSTPRDICIQLPDVDLYEALESIPSPHLNGEWVYNGTSPSFIVIDGSEMSVTIPYSSGPPLVDQETFELTYRVEGIAPCDSFMETTINVSVTRQVFSGYSNNIRICEDAIKNGDFDTNIDITDDEFLALEDIEGTWSTAGFGQITSPTDSSINIKDVYDQIIARDGVRFGCSQFSYTYSVDQRSGVCDDASSSVGFKIYESLRPFDSTGDLEYCEGETPTTTINLYDQLEFTTENGVLFDYPNDSCTNWQLVSGPSNLGLVSNEEGLCSTVEDPFYTSQGTIDLSDAEAGVYVFQYTVLPEYNCSDDDFASIIYTPDYCGSQFVLYNPCNVETAQVVIRVYPKHYAGEDTTGLEFCEIDPIIANPLDLFTLMTTNGIDDSIYQGTEGLWTDINSNTTVSNIFTIPTISGEETFNFRYTTTTLNGCVNQADLSFTVYEEYQPGVDASIDICNNDVAVNLFNSLTGNPSINGTWTGPNAYTSTTYQGAVDPEVIISGDYIYTVPANTNADGTILCEGDSAIVTVTIHESPNAGSDMIATLCELDTEIEIDLIDLLDSTADSGGVFVDLDGTNLLSESILNVSALTPGTYNFQYEIQGNIACATSSAIISITINEVSPPTATNQTFCMSDGATVSDLEVSNGLSYNWYDTIDSNIPLVLSEPLINGEDYFVSALDADDCESSRESIIVTLLPVNHVDCETCIKDGITPNDDGMNDEFDLCDLPVAFPDFEINIYNRYGTIVYKGNRNTDLFNGVSNMPLTIGEGLPSGVYFYIFDPKDGVTKAFQGNFYLSR